MPAQSGNNLSISQIRDGLINPNFTTPLYVSANSFTVAGDVTSWLRPGRGLVITFQTSGVKRGAVRNVFYDSGTNKSTINVIGDSLVNEPITSVLISLSDMEGAFSKFDPNLVLYFPFEEGTGTMTKDLSGWSNHGTLVNGPTWSTGRAGKCLNFDGSDDYVDCGNSDSLAITKPITIECWIKINVANAGFILCKNTDYGSSSHYQFGLDIYNSKVRFLPQTANVRSNTALSTGQWYHFIAQVDANNNGKYFLNGVEDGTFSRVEGSSTCSLLIGARRTTNSTTISDYFNGCIDEVRIYNRILSASEIQDHYLNP